MHNFIESYAQANVEAESSSNILIKPIKKKIDEIHPRMNCCLRLYGDIKFQDAV